MRIYLDTSAWNNLLGWAARKSTRYFHQYEILFSSCNLDEIAFAGQHRARELAGLAWRITNRRQLCDHILLTIREVEAMCKGQEVGIFRKDPQFELVWEQLRGDGLGRDQREILKSQAHAAKQVYRDWLRNTRYDFAPVFRACAQVGIKKPWAELLDEIEAEGYLHRQLVVTLRAEGQSQLADWLIPQPPTTYRELPGTACWMQYYTSLSYLAVNPRRLTERGLAS